ncbi:IGHMBP2 family helicase [Fusibacter sp. JL216-2]|uniref:IGHMBP2 family helicase n=1 Tax=Fusibacter sp. JL216-2 TaxID=3071453 RepID=UPI003D33FD90
MFGSRTHYINHFRRLINMERQADIKRHEDEIKALSGGARERKGRALLNMRGRRAGRLYGNQHMIKYMKADVGQALPELDMNVGDVVVISQGQPLKKGNPLGTIIEKRAHALIVLFDGAPEKWMVKRGLRVDLYVNDVTYRRMQEALDSLMYGRESSPRLMNWLIGEKDKYVAPYEKQIPHVDNLDLSFYNESLNISQKQAVLRALAAEDFHIVHGPPGTGKTVTGVEILHQAKDRYKTILATADSNGAVDNIALGLVNSGVKVVRVGRPFRVSNALEDVTLDARLSLDPDYEKVEAFREMAFTKMKDQSGLKHPSPRWTRGLKTGDIHRLARKGKGSRGVPASDVQSMSKWLKIREEIDKCFEKADALESEITQRILEEADVILCTNSGAGQALLEGYTFDLVLIDEATQSTESSALIPAVKGKRLVLLGDHKQLPPTVISQEADEKGFSVSLLERMIDRYGPGVVTLLDTQYRMNENIMAFPNRVFYEGKLQAGKVNKDWRLAGLNVDMISNAGLLRCIQDARGFVDVAGKEKRVAEGFSVMNPLEGKYVVKIMQDLMGLGVSGKDIGIISPYKAQVKLIRSLIDPLISDQVQVDTVDGFQGQEKEVIILSLVRSNDEGHLGFLNDTRRLNVALTRAKKLRITVGNSLCIKNHALYADFVESENKVTIDLP